MGSSTKQRWTQCSGGGPALIAIQQVNNETGVIQPLDRILEKVRAAGSLLLVDCAQSAGKMPLPDADFIAACAHKLGGPPGIGVLLVRDLAMLEPIGGQEMGYRRGTQDMPAALAFAAALSAQPYEMERLSTLRSRLEDGVRKLGRPRDRRRRARGSQRSGRLLCLAFQAHPFWCSSISRELQYRREVLVLRARMKASEVLAAMNVPRGCRRQLCPRKLRALDRGKPISTVSSTNGARSPLE